MLMGSGTSIKVDAVGENAATGLPCCPLPWGKGDKPEEPQR
jgi:hypothetical protein